MPSNWLYIDTNFPTFTGEEDVEEKVETIQDYMFMLVEQLRYSLHNLDLTNMNQTAVSQFTGSITEPLYGRIEDDEGNITQLQATAQGLATQISNANGDISRLQQTATSLQSQISSANGRISTIAQSVDSIYLGVSNGTDHSYIYLYKDGVAVSSKKIMFSGMVTFTDLSTEGYTTINGGNITTGTISAITMRGNTIIGGTISGVAITGGTVTGATLRSVSSEDNGLEIYYGSCTPNTLVGGIKFDANGAGTEDEARYRVFLYTRYTYGVAWALKLQSAGGLSIESNGILYVHSSGNTILRAGGTLTLNNPVLTSGNVRWSFGSDGIYRNGAKWAPWEK